MVGVNDHAEPAARLRMATSRALVTSAAVWVLSMDHPTTPADAGIQHHRAVDLPSRVGCSVISVTHSWSGACGVTAHQKIPSLKIMSGGKRGAKSS